MNKLNLKVGDLLFYHNPNYLGIILSIDDSKLSNDNPKIKEPYIIYWFCFSKSESDCCFNYGENELKRNFKENRLFLSIEDFNVYKKQT